MRPDISWLDSSGRTRVIIDVKYKQVDRAVAQDVHQTVAYCVAAGINDAVLIYAECPAEEHVVGDSGIRIHQMSLPLRGAIEDVKRSTNRVAERLLSLRTW